jgi:hypothetical protein
MRPREQHTRIRLWRNADHAAMLVFCDMWCREMSAAERERCYAANKKINRNKRGYSGVRDNRLWGRALARDADKSIAISRRRVRPHVSQVSMVDEGLGCKEASKWSCICSPPASNMDLLLIYLRLPIEDHRDDDIPMLMFCQFPQTPLKCWGSALTRHGY